MCFVAYLHHPKCLDTRGMKAGRSPHTFLAVLCDLMLSHFIAANPQVFATLFTYVILGKKISQDQEIFPYPCQIQQYQLWCSLQ